MTNLLYQIALTLVKGIGPITAKQIVENLDDVSLLFTEPKNRLESLCGFPRRIIDEIQNKSVLQRAEKEIAFLEKAKITPLFYTSEDYPERLRLCADAPVMLYYKGNADLNRQKIISIVGTRNATDYGRSMIENLISELKETFPDTLIVSGLAYGIDIAAHRTSLKYGIDTVAVLAHGLDRIYPYQHRDTAADMLQRGGVLTEYLSETSPDRPNFIKRNRIVAGLSDCTVIVESARKGGATITAGLALDYDRDVLAFPGRADHPYSAGCNELIRSRRAALITCSEDLFKEMNWLKGDDFAANTPVQQTLFPQLTESEQRVVDVIASQGEVQLNSLATLLDYPVNKLSVMLFSLEMNGVICCKAGSVYKLVK